MNTASVHNLADYRKSAPPAASAPTESASPPDARRAPEPTAPFTYPPARPIVEWMPGREPVEAQVDGAFRGLAMLAAAGALAIVAGAVLTAIAGAFAVVATGGDPAHVAGDRVAGVSGQG